MTILKNERALTYKELRNEKISLARSTIWKLERLGLFPKRRKNGRRVYWLESDIDAWLAQMPIGGDV